MTSATLLADGSSDRVLVHVLRWLFAQHGVSAEVNFADPRVMASPPRSLVDRARAALKLFPADILFVHRDAEGAPPNNRYREITDAVSIATPRHVAVVPVRMTEAWFLFDQAALRRAAGNPNSRQPLSLPSLDRTESLADPKDALHQALLDASELPPQRRRKFRTHVAFQQLAEFIEDFAPLRQLPSFQALEHDIETAIANTRVRPDDPSSH